MKGIKIRKTGQHISAQRKIRDQGLGIKLIPY